MTDESQQQPANPDQPFSMPPSVAPSSPAYPPASAGKEAKRRSRLRLVIGVIAGVLVLCCGGTVVIALTTGSPKTSAAGNSVATATSRAGSSPVAQGAASPSHSAAPATAASAKAGKPDYNAAAEILLANDQHYRDELAAGEDDFHTPSFGSWYQTVTNDLSFQTAFTKADAYFNADNEPNSISTWRVDVMQADSDLDEWANAAVSADPSGASAQMRQYAATFNKDMAKADADAADVAAGK